MKLRILPQTILNFILFLVFLSGVTLLQASFYQKEIIDEEKNKDYQQEEQNLKTIVELQKKIPSFGFDNLVADWNFLQFIQYFGDTKAREETGYSLVTDYFEIVVKNDPRFISAFLQLSSANTLFAAEPKKTVELMDQVLTHISPELSNRAFFVWIYKGVDEILFLADPKKAANSYQNAADWTQEREDTKNTRIALSLQQTAQFYRDLVRNPDPEKLRLAKINSWTTILANVNDRPTQEIAVKELQKLGAKVRITPEGQLKIDANPQN